jgi:hypothetical protein
MFSTFIRSTARFDSFLSADWTYPGPNWLASQTNATPMKPLQLTALIITSNHIAVTNAMADAVFPIISTLLILDITHFLISITIFRCRRRDCFVIFFGRPRIGVAKFAAVGRSWRILVSRLSEFVET